MKFTIPGEFISLNDYINKERANKFAAYAIKKEETERVNWEARIQHLPHLEHPVYLEFHWYCKNKKKDPDNIIFAKKFILDGMVQAQVLRGDGWEDILGIEDHWDIDSTNPRVEIYIEPNGKET